MKSYVKFVNGFLFESLFLYRIEVSFVLICNFGCKFDIIFFENVVKYRIKYYLVLKNYIFLLGVCR